MIRQLKFVTTNAGKFKSAQKYLADRGIVVKQLALELPELRTDDIQQIATQKALFAFREIQQPVIVHDTGFYIEALNGFPGFCIGYTLQKIGIDGLTKLISKPSTAKFVSILAYMDGTTPSPILFEDVYSGTLLNKVSGERKSFFWSDLFLSFIPNNGTKTLASLSEQEFRELEKSFDKESCFFKFTDWYLSKEQHE